MHNLSSGCGECVSHFFSAERHNMEFHNAYSSPKVINGQIKEVDMDGGYVACTGAVRMRTEF
jgi:hypothetical protein